MPTHKIAPSILAADFGNLERDISMINQSESDWLHIDIMDGIFVPNISFGQAITKRMGELCEKPLDVHLMIMQPERYVEQFRDAGAEIITVHYEACRHLHRTVSRIKELGMKAGVALNPHTPVSVLEEIAADLDLVLIMSVNPGFGGQKFIHASVDKVRSLVELRTRKNASFIIEVDGGVNMETGKLLAEAGAEALVAGSFVFNSASPQETISNLKSL